MASLHRDTVSSALARVLCSGASALGDLIGVDAHRADARDGNAARGTSMRAHRCARASQNTHASPSAEVEDLLVLIVVEEIARRDNVAADARVRRAVIHPSMQQSLWDKPRALGRIAYRHGHHALFTGAEPSRAA
jgi:hypothetical protein